MSPIIYIHVLDQAQKSIGVLLATCARVITITTIIFTSIGSAGISSHVNLSGNAWLSHQNKSNNIYFNLVLQVTATSLKNMPPFKT